MEQIDNEKENISIQVDLYSVSLVAYEMISGVNPMSLVVVLFHKLLEKLIMENLTI